MKQLFSFPNPVNEVSARLVAAAVAPLALATVLFGLRWMLPVLAYGFVARTLTGPTLSPLGALVTRVVTPRLAIAPRPVPGPPKRFAQAIGATLSLGACVLAFGFDTDAAAFALIGIVCVAATLEAGFGLCLGCKLFALLMRAGLVPQRVCAECADIGLRA